MINFRKFGKDQRGTFKYWFWHALAFNVTAIRLGHWRPKYIFHDMDKPILMLLSGGNYEWVRKVHREHNRHHLSYKGHHEQDWEAMVIDWESSKLTKNACPMDFKQKLYQMRTEGGLGDYPYINLIYHGMKLGLCKASVAIAHIINTYLENMDKNPVVFKDKE